MEATSLYIVPTPIGNLEDITLRALRILGEVDFILAEDTRTSGVLLKKYEISTPLVSHHIHNEHKTLESVIKRLSDGEVAALVSDAGTPAISDPGYLLVRECLRNDIKVECLPGATAFVPALVKSGFPCDSFVFEGFLPHKKGKQTKILSLKEEQRTVIYYESPHRILKSLQMIAELIGPQRKVSVSREITKLHEETVTGSVEEVIEHFSKGTVKGEIVLVVHGNE